MDSITIPIHSFVDLITNSSSETYITATKKSISVVKEIIRLYLDKAGVTTPVDDLFSVKIVYEDYDDETGEEVEKEGSSEYRPSYLKIKAKKGVKEYDELVKVLNSLNFAFESVEFMN